MKRPTAKRLGREAMHYDGYQLILEPKDYKKVVKRFNHEAVRELANQACATFLSVFGLHPEGEVFHGLTMKKLAALSVAGRRIGILSLSARKRLEKIYENNKRTRRAKIKVAKVVSMPEEISVS